MTRKKLLTLLMALLAIMWGVDQTFAAKPAPKKLQKITPAERKAAAKRAAAAGVIPGVAGLAARAALPLSGIEGPGGVPHYFGPYGNWAYSPLPKGSIGTITVDAGGSGYTAPTVEILDAYGTGSGATASISASQIDATGAITGITVDLPGSGYSAPTVVITDPAGVDAAATATLTGLTGGMPKFIDSVPLLGPGGANNLGQYIPVGVAQGWPLGCTTACTADYYQIGLVEYEEKMHSSLPKTRLRGYVQIVPQGWTGTDLLGNSLSAVALTVSNGLTQDVTIGGVQAYGATIPHNLGPVIVAKGRAHGVAGAAGEAKPVRIKFYNLLPTGTGGDLFLPVDETVPGSGFGPALPGAAGDKFTQNRATIHLHGNNTVWISDGNTHQWITPANETTPYPAGVSARNVPDMTDCDADPVGNPGMPEDKGCSTFYYTNAQSARLQFYHDHAMGITRLNVYAGEAAGYVLTDAVDQDMIKGTNLSGVNPGGLKVLPDIGIPLVIQDRTWVDAETIYAQDPTWNWGTRPSGTANTGDLWFPHVYMSAQNPWDLAGVNAFGRWHYGPWFNPPVPECVNGGPVGCIDVGPVPNEYHQPVCETNPADPGCTAPWEPPFRPGVPNPSIPGEAFMDTPTVNGTAYPYIEVEPKAYRFRILSAANDRFFNLQLYQAYDKTSWMPGTGSAAPGSPTAVCGTDPTVCTEVKMISVDGQPNQVADWPSGIPDPTTAGPPWIMIGTEGGFMPKPVVVPQTPIGWNLNPTTFNFGTVNQHSLLLGAAERADVVVDFTGLGGKTFILYNDAPAAFPAGVPTYDYYTGVANQMDAGGAPTTQPGYGPNTRTIMQIRVNKPLTTPTTDVSLANLQAVFAKTATKRGVFEVSQDPIIIPQAAYNSAYNKTFPTSAAAQYIQIADTAKTFQPIDSSGNPQPVMTLPLEMKAMHDEMGGVYDTQFGRMSGMLGLTNPLSPVHVLIPYGYASPPTDLVKGSVDSTPVGQMPDGTQIWRIFHNGVDTHTIHTHLFHAQLVNRLGQDGLLLPIDPIELGWKDTFRVNPLEITYLAMRPTVPTQGQVPFEVPDSVRLIDPTLPEGATLIPPPPAGWFDPNGVAIPQILNHTVNFGWEYVWHCHILAHEEMDMMHSLVFAVPPKPPTLSTTYTVSGGSGNRRVNLSWTDNSQKEAGYTVQRASDQGFTAGLRTFPLARNVVTFQDSTVSNNTFYWYRVFAVGATVGDTQTVGFPTMFADAPSNGVLVQVGTPPGALTAPAAPTNLTAAPPIGPQVSLSWTDNATNEANFVLERCTGAGCTNFAQIAAPGPRTTTPPGPVTYVDATVTANTAYSYRVKAVNAAGSSAYTNTASVMVPGVPAAPTNATVAVVKANGNKYTATLRWAYGLNPTNFTIQRATNLSFTTGLSTSTIAGSLRMTTQSVDKNATYYYRIRANTVAGMSSWTNVLPFPVRTGP